MYVASCVAELDTTLAETAPISAINKVSLENNTDLFIDFSVDLRAGAATPLGVVPILGSTHSENRILHFDWSDWDGQPPLVNLLDANRHSLDPRLWPQDPDGRGVVSGHPIYGDRKFFCRPGTREFHTHPQHQNEPWDERRPVLSLAQIVLDLVNDLTKRFIYG